VYAAWSYAAGQRHGPGVSYAGRQPGTEVKSWRWRAMPRRPLTRPKSENVVYIFGFRRDQADERPGQMPRRAGVTGVRAVRPPSARLSQTGSSVWSPEKSVTAADDPLWW